MSVISFEEARQKRARASTSDVELTPNTASELAGQQPTSEDAKAFLVLAEAHFKGFTTKSTYARKHADIVAMLACCGYISNQIDEYTWSNLWKITAEGLMFLQFALNTGAKRDD